MISECTEWWETPVNQFIVQRPFDRRVHDLILEQLSQIGHSEYFRWLLLDRLTRMNWIETIRKIYAHDPTYKNMLFEDRERGIEQMKTGAKGMHLGYRA